MNCPTTRPLTASVLLTASKERVEAFSVCLFYPRHTQVISNKTRILLINSEAGRNTTIKLNKYKFSLGWEMFLGACTSGKKLLWSSIRSCSTTLSWAIFFSSISYYYENSYCTVFISFINSPQNLVITCFKTVFSMWLVKFYLFTLYSLNKCMQIQWGVSL